MIPKQREMDSVVRDIYNAMQHQEHLRSTLLVLCGDHGMNEAGNHGGSSPGETSPALTFISPKFQSIRKDEILSPVQFVEDFQYYQGVDQSDISPTLAGLLRFPVPVNNLGVFIPKFLDMWNQGLPFLFPFSLFWLGSHINLRLGPERLGILLENARQILRVVEVTFPGFEFPESPSLNNRNCVSATGLIGLECDWQATLQLVYEAYQKSESSPEAESALLAISRKAQGIMSSAASNYDLSKLVIGSMLAGIATVLSFITSFTAISKSAAPGIFFIFTVTSYGIMMFASSYVEEEQQFWYWIFSGWILYLHIKS